MTAALKEDSDSRRYHFNFNVEDESVPMLKSDFFGGGGVVSAGDFAGAIKALKSMVNNT
jgi:hypothetical protein